MSAQARRGPLGEGLGLNVPVTDKSIVCKMQTCISRTLGI